MAEIDAISWPELIGASAKSVFTVAACASVGAYARHTGILNADAEKKLGKLITSIFLPCLVFQKLVATTNLAVIISLWPLTFMCLATVFYGLTTGFACGRVLSKDMRNLVMVATAFPNSFSVPLTLMLALGPRPEFLANSTMTEAELEDHINTYFLMSYSLWILARWTIGHPILQGAQSVRTWLDKVLNPPVVASLLGALVGAVWSFLPADFQEQVGTSPVLHPFQTAFKYAGQCAVPCILMTLGANLYEAVRSIFQKPVPVEAQVEAGVVPAEGQVEEGVQPSKKTSALPAWAYLLVIVLRQVFGPLIGAGVALGFLRPVCGITNPIVLMVGMLQCAGPPMINLAVMVGMSDSGQKETATLLLLTYSFSLISWTCSIALFLSLL